MSETSVADEFESLIRAVAPPAWVVAHDAGDENALRALAEGADADELTRAVSAEGWLTSDWPLTYGGRGLSGEQLAHVRATIRRWHLGSVRGAIGSGWIGPTILQLGTDAQRLRYLPPIARFEELWCQLFSEPDAGSDLAAVRSSATKVDDGWMLRGQKVWTSRANIAAYGLAVVRSDPDAPKHAGLTCFVVDINAPGVIVRPIKQMTGDSEFFEVFFDDCVVPDDNRVGEIGQGWAVVKTALGFERIAGSGLGASPPGSVIGRSIDEFLDTYRGRLDTRHRDRVVRMYVEAQLIALNNARAVAARAAGRPPGPEGATNKILQAGHTQRLQELFVDIAGPRGVAWSSSDEWSSSNGWAFLRVRAKTIAGGTSEILRNQVAERVLGLPRDDDPTLGRSWSEAMALRASQGTER